MTQCSTNSLYSGNGRVAHRSMCANPSITLCVNKHYHYRKFLLLVILKGGSLTKSGRREEGVCVCVRDAITAGSTMNTA